MTLTEFLAELKMRMQPTPVGDGGANDSGSVGAFDYLAELTAAVHDAARFPTVFNRLKADKTMKREDIVAIASRFAFPMAKSTTRKLALERIWRQHAASETMGAKIRSMAGKSAA